MVFVDLVSIDGAKATFEYRPESKAAKCGLIEVDSNSGESRLIKKSPDDDMPDNVWYIPYAIDSAKRMLNETPVREHDVCAWY
ncbi:MAG: hypothetical protein KHZ79_07235 [Atopobium minutum]|uniref:hypothetical protein n=1 Tax=Atopobium minutum TaxID=1381 RepID=UPI001D87DB07|nr:hypothetical protein [Atopobium minutum]MBS4874150.1 hypothetical protein [Atopobium minutum]